MEDFFRNNLRCQDALSKITDPLKHNFGIDIFWHVTVHEDGFLSNICNFYDQWGYCWENQCYKNMHFLVAPSCLKSGCFYLDFDKNFEKVQDKLEEKYPLYHPLITIRKEGKSKAHIFGFASKQNRANLPSFYSNNIPILNSYIDYFLEQTLKLKNRTEENMINLAVLKGKNLYYNKSYGLNSLPKPEQHSRFLQQIGVAPALFTFAKKLSRREKEALNACYEHKTAKEHAQALGISSRTVEYHLENARNKLGIFTRDRLLESVRLLKMAGLLD